MSTLAASDKYIIELIVVHSIINVAFHGYDDKVQSVQMEALYFFLNISLLGNPTSVIVLYTRGFLPCISGAFKIIRDTKMIKNMLATLLNVIEKSSNAL